MRINLRRWTDGISGWRDRGSGHPHERREPMLSRFEPLEPRVLLSAGVSADLLDLGKYVAEKDVVAASTDVRSNWPPPSKPSGPATALVGQRVAFKTDGTDPLGVHDYMFDWGDGSKLKWSSKTNQSHVYTAAGTYTIRAKEKCPLDAFVSDWSGGRTITVTVAAPNTAAPVLDNTGDMQLNSVNEDDKLSGGTTVAAIIASAGGDRITDADAGASEGIALIGVNTTHGTWQYWSSSLQKWASVGKVSVKTALLLQDTDKLRLVPAKNFNGSAPDAILFRAWDQSNWGLDGIADTTVNGGTTAFSTATETASIAVAPVNDAPVLNTGGDMRLPTIDKTAPTNPGTAVADLIASGGGNRITDIDVAALEGIAVTRVDNSHGTWQYSTDAGTNWDDFGTPSEAQARLLRPEDLVRFVPNDDFSGSLASGLGFRAWDQTTGIAGGHANISGYGGMTAFSTATESVRVLVNPITVTAATPYVSPSVSVKLKGAGTCELHFAANGVDLVQIILRGTDWLSTLSIEVKKNVVGGAGLITVQEIVFEQVGGQDSHLRSIKGKGVDLASVAPPSITPLPPDSVAKVQLHNYTYPI